MSDDHNLLTLRTVVERIKILDITVTHQCINNMDNKRAKVQQEYMANLHISYITI